MKNLLEIQNSFKLGAYCHVLIDHEREKVLRKLGFYDLLSSNKVLPYAMKFVEDEMTYSRVKNWPEIISYFNEIFEEEVELVPRKSVVKWHNLFQDYSAKPPTEQTVADFINGLGFDNEIIKTT